MDGATAKAKERLMPALVLGAFCECLGMAFLLAAIVGSGIMDSSLRCSRSWPSRDKPRSAALGSCQAGAAGGACTLRSARLS
jgi:hypothetical protein